MEGSGEAEPGVVVAGGLVRSHRDPAPLLELVEASLDDVAAAVAVPSLVAEVDWPSSPPAAVGDLIVAFRDRRGDTSLAQPGPIRTGGVALVYGHSVGASTRATRRSGNTDLLKCVSDSMLVSADWPGVRMNASARPFPSQTRSFLVVRPPRERPIAWSGGSSPNFL